ncbi:hypothetical protein [Salipiger mucosus]|uniref:hypothetical protein n=1 Tax=Salipiger mucosus TaxID=263378 RepID=UPI0012EC3898|nr:hypothetical protein [Salipiger mucosus]
MVRDALFPLSYLRLVREDGKYLLRRDVFSLVLVAIGTISMLFLAPGLNFFGPSGLVDRAGSLSSTLTGFYVAALVAAATFTSHISDLDKYIPNGKLYLKDSLNVASNLEEDEQHFGEEITRRQFICSIFGYLAFMALAISIVSIILVAISSAIPPKNLYGATPFLVYLIAPLYLMAVAHMAITTARGIYYLSYKIYLGDGEPL